MEFIGVFSDLHEFYKIYNNNNLENCNYIQDYLNSITSIEYLNTVNINKELINNLFNNYEKSFGNYTKHLEVDFDNNYNKYIKRFINEIDEFIKLKIKFMKNINNYEIIKTRSIDDNNYKKCINDLKNFNNNINIYINKLNEMYINYRMSYYKSFFNILSLLKSSKDLINIAENLENSYKLNKGNPNIAYVKFIISGKEQIMYVGEIIKNSIDFYLEDFNINIEKSIFSLLILLTNKLSNTDFEDFKKSYRVKSDKVKSEMLNKKIQEFNLSYIQQKNNIEKHKEDQLKNLTKHIQMRNNDPKSNKMITEQIRNNTIKMITQDYSNSIKSLDDMKKYVINNIKTDFNKYYDTEELNTIIK